MNPCTYFASGAEFRAWLEEHHASATELVLGFYKKTAKRGGITYPEALDEALCFGWIDGVRKSVDAHSYSIRFTPRKSRSIWSLVNLKHMERLINANRVAPSGLEAFKARDPQRTGVYSFENRPSQLSREEQAQFQNDPTAWTFFSGQPPHYRRTAIWWVISAKKEETKARRLAHLIEDSRNGRKIAQLDGKRKSQTGF